MSDLDRAVDDRLASYGAAITVPPFAAVERKYRRRRIIRTATTVGLAAVAVFGGVALIQDVGGRSSDTLAPFATAAPEPERSAHAGPASPSLTFHAVLGPGDADAATGPADVDPAVGATVLVDGSTPLQIGPAVLTDEHISGATAVDAGLIELVFTEDGAHRWQQLTATAACQPAGEVTRRLVVLLNGTVLSSPLLGPDVPCGVGLTSRSTQIANSLTAKQTEDLASDLSPA